MRSEWSFDKSQRLIRRFCENSKKRRYLAGGKDLNPGRLPFAFGLFGSSVMIPEMLQTLYTASDAGPLLGPGAAVITILAPLVVLTVSKIGHCRMLAMSFVIAALSFVYFHMERSGKFNDESRVSFRLRQS